ncbi:MAG: hypothetical protein JRF50_09160 [Deltaproteobacteria bacterium]|nr:hypothetical protein [Deltaproteobacteria bacterium]
MTKNQEVDGYTEEVKGKIKNLGADLVGVTGAVPLKQLELDPPDLLNFFQRALSIALRLPKAVGRLGGLGWQSKSLLLVNPDYGPRTRLATILTDAPLNPHGPIENRCGDCTKCKDACPPGAIKGASTKDHYRSREDAREHKRPLQK